MSDVAYQKLIEEDQQARTQALDVMRSFLVQAPAGSGKTELLIRRMLALLARVDRPERILAMTFTRKAAAEMRERIVTALRAAHAGTPLASPHEQQTRDLALAVLAQDTKQQWHLMEQPSRLQVMTIDAFCAQLLRQTPLTNRWGAMPSFEEFVQPRYEAAVREALRDADNEAQPFWHEVLKTLGNDGDRLVQAMSALLMKREQWLPLFGSALQQDQREMLQEVLSTEIKNELTQVHGVLQRMWSATERETLRMAMRYAAGHLDADDATKALAQTLVMCAERKEIWPLPEPEALEDWVHLADWLLTKEGKWRKSFRKNEGFPSQKEGGNAALKKAIGALLEEQGGDCTALARVQVLPSGRYHGNEWRFIDALLYLLPRLLAYFQWKCAHDGVIDFAEAQLAAIEALGEEDAPSDVLLALDMRIEHLLIDEFQDTSQTQMTLLRKLTSGWQPGDGRTLFAVGDPMQSIYRFRQAEVGLFLEAQAAQRINDVPVTLLTLTRNFRSQARLVDWTNVVFPEVFSRDQDAWRGAVTFKASAPTHAATEEDVTVCVLTDPLEEGVYVAQQTEEALKRGVQEVAILVRARTHLSEILPALRTRNIAFTAVRLDCLGDKQAVMDLLMLTRTLVQPNDELAWLSVLRAPWCGLTLADLTALARGRSFPQEERGASQEEKPRLRHWSEWLLALPERIDGLSEDGHRRLTRLLQCWQTAYETCHDRLAQRVHRCWLALLGPSCLDGCADALAAARFFECLDAEDVAGGIPDWLLFKRRLDEAFLPEDVIGAEEADVRVKVMTLHQAKGLQFDTVIMPGLGRGTGQSETPLLRWRQRPQGLLLAARRTRAEMKTEKDAEMYSGLDCYLALLEKEEAHHELARLLYVGVTRAKRQLILTTVADVKEDKKAADDGGLLQWVPPKEGAAMALWWEALCAKGMITPPAIETTAMETASSFSGSDSGLPLRRLSGASVELKNAPAVIERPRSHAVPLSFNEANVAARHVGTLVHDWLSRVGLPDGQRLQDWTPTFLEAQRETMAHALVELGVPMAQRDEAVRRVIAALSAVRDDPFAQWLLDPARGTTQEGARNEWALSATFHQDNRHVRLDRTFIDGDVRWIVDYKTAETDAINIEAWLDAEVEKYRPQMEGYAALMKRFEERPLKLVLYYPLLQRWREIAPIAGRTNQ
ncbi:MAG: UvrD-helicase domain-containing protein [Burkholderiales bacterium]|jgi:ATP-dependent exoDNAse (exonuclease V) beta subunit|nr:UvrD-helicase domain-containing protein [Burkholderiales bacterium]